MLAQDIRDLVRRQPFRPFRITLTDGRSYDVRHPELALVGRSTVVIGIPPKDFNEADPIFDRLKIVDLLHIMEAEQIEAGAK